MRVAVHRQCALRRHAQVRMASTRKHGLPAVESPSRPAAKRSDAGEQQSPWRFLRAAGSLAAAAAAAAVFRSPPRVAVAPSAGASGGEPRSQPRKLQFSEAATLPTAPAPSHDARMLAPDATLPEVAAFLCGDGNIHTNWLGYKRIKQYFMFLTFANRAPSNPVPPHSTHRRRHYATRR